MISNAVTADQLSVSVKCKKTTGLMVLIRFGMKALHLVVQLGKAFSFSCDLLYTLSSQADLKYGIGMK